MDSTATTISLLVILAVAGCANPQEHVRVTTACPEVDVDPGTYLYVHATTGERAIEGAVVEASGPEEQHVRDVTNSLGCALLVVTPGSWEGTVTTAEKSETFRAVAHLNGTTDVLVVING